MHIYAETLGGSLLLAGGLFYAMGREVKGLDQATIAANTFRVFITVAIAVGLIVGGLIDATSG